MSCAGGEGDEGCGEGEVGEGEVEGGGEVFWWWVSGGGGRAGEGRGRKGRGGWRVGGGEGVPGTKPIRKGVDMVSWVGGYLTIYGGEILVIVFVS